MIKSLSLLLNTRSLNLTLKLKNKFLALNAKEFINAQYLNIDF